MLISGRLWKLPLCGKVLEKTNDRFASPFHGSASKHAESPSTPEAWTMKRKLSDAKQVRGSGITAPPRVNLCLLDQTLNFFHDKLCSWFFGGSFVGLCPLPALPSACSRRSGRIHLIIVKVEPTIAIASSAYITYSNGFERAYTSNCLPKYNASSATSKYLNMRPAKTTRSSFLLEY